MTLSSGWTPFYKYLFVPIWISAIALGTVMVFLDPEAQTRRVDRWEFAMVALVGISYAYWSCARVKQVVLDSDRLLISNYLQTVEVPLRDIERVSGSILMSPELVWVRFHTRTRFGWKIVFMGQWRFHWTFSPHPVVEVHPSSFILDPESCLPAAAAAAAETQ